jgi:hypothetical protein
MMNLSNAVRTMAGEALVKPPVCASASGHLHISRAQVLATALALAASAHAADPAYLPGGEAVRAAVASRQGKTELSKLAAAMKPGTWAEIKTTMPPKLWTSPPPSRGLHIAGWTDDAHWDSLTGQFLYMGLRQTRQFIAYAETNNTWRVIALDKKSDNPCFQTAFGHIYSSNGFDHERSQFYHRYNGFTSKEDGLSLTGGISRFDVVTEKWTKLPPMTKGLGGGMAIEYFGAMDGLISLGTKPGFFSTVRQKWEALGTSPVDGYHSLIRHNPYRQEVLMAGGNNNQRVVARIKKDGQIERLKDFPGDFGLSSDKITVDPVSGLYLMFSWKNEGLKCYEFDSDKNEYRLLEATAAAYPYKSYSATYSVCAFIPEYGVIMWAEPRGVFLYKHNAATNGTEMTN